MAQTYKFTVSMPVTDITPRNRISNTFHMQHVSGGLLDTDLESMCQDIVEMYKLRYGISSQEIQCKAYDTDAKPNYPRASAIINAGSVWDCPHPREVALCLSFAGPNRGNRNERGRLYLMPSIAAGAAGGIDFARPSTTAMAWAMAFYTTANASFPDLGGVDWKFGIWSHKLQSFRQSVQAWCNDEWDTVRRRGLRETTRQSVSRDG